MDTGTLEDYLSWRGDLSFSEKPFNEVDNLIFCYLSYAALKGLAKEDENEKGLTLKEYVDRLMAKGGYKTNLEIYASESFLKKAASSKRFGPVILKDYVDITDTLTSIQFSAVTFQYLPKASYIAYRGTDDTTIGWKEDFMISYTKVRAQDMALEYLKNHLYPGHQDQVGGHSKGGNLALYAASLLPDELLERLTAIYLNDSPSSCPEVLDPHTFDHLQDKLVRILPEYSVIGMLFHFPVKNEKIVPSYAKGLNQHDLTTWEVRADGLVAANGLDPEAKSIDAAISGWLTNMTLLQREKFSHDLFNAITLDGKFKTVSAFRNQGMKALQGALIQLALKDPSTRATMVRLPLTVVFGRRIMGLRHHRPIEFLLNNSLPVGVFIFIIGLLFLFVPKEALPILILTLLSIATVAQLVFLIYLLYLSRWHFETQLMRIYLLIVLTVFTVAMYINQDMLAIFSSIIFGTACLIFSFSIFGKVPSYSHRKDYFMVVWSILESLVVLTAGIYFIVASGYSVDVINSLMGYLAIGVGAFLIVLGLVQVLHEKKASDKQK
jgi:hypothetical protein